MSNSPSVSPLGGGVVAVAGVQHAVAMFAGVVMVPILVARGAGFDAATTIAMTTAAVWVSGLATLLQASRIGHIGSGYLCVMGSSALFIAPCIAAGKAGGPGLIFGMALALSPLEFGIGYLVPLLRRISPPPVVGSIILLIGLSVLPISVSLFGGGPGPGLGTGRNLALGAVTVIATLAAACSRRPWVRISAVLVGLGVGYDLASCLGMVDWEPVLAAPWLGFPRLLATPLAFSPAHILPFALAYLVTSIETFGDMNTIAEITDGRLETAGHGRLRGGLLADAVGSALAGLFGTTPNTSYSGNLAIVQLTGVTARAAGFVAGGVLLALGLMPKLGALISVMPAPVVGGGMLVAVAMLLGIGMRIAMREGHDNRCLLIVGVACACGLGVQNVPDIAQHAPDWLRPLCASGTLVGALVAIGLHLTLPRAKVAADG